MRRLVWVAGAPAADAAELARYVVGIAKVRALELSEPAEARLRQLATEPGDIVVIGELCRLDGRSLLPIVGLDLFRLLRPSGLVLLEFFFKPRAEVEQRGDVEIVHRDKAQLTELQALREQQELLRAYAAGLCAASGSRLELLRVDRADLKAGMERLEALLKSLRT